MPVIVQLILRTLVGDLICIRARYAMPCIDIAHGSTAPLSAYVCGLRWPVLASRMVLSAYVRPGTGIA
eukprot:2604779-Rhodomonas_salina.2